MAVRKIMKSVPADFLAAKGIFKHDYDAITSCQRECTARLAMSIQMEQEAYMSQHPEIIAMLTLFISKMATGMKHMLEVLKEAHGFFLQNKEDLDELIRKQLGIGPEGSYISSDAALYHFNDEEQLLRDLRAIIIGHFPFTTQSALHTPPVTPLTQSSSFISVSTSCSTLPTPEPIPTPELTLSENMFIVVSNTVDKAIYSKVNELELKYDTAYVELTKAVEAAMEIPVMEIKQDLYDLFEKAYQNFDNIIIEKERIAAQLAWDKRMRKKMKRTLRRQENFRGYMTPPTPKSEVSSHESYKVPPPKPCLCHPQWRYNRYKKDRFGIYTPIQAYEYGGENVTVTPVLSQDNMEEKTETETTETSEGPR